MNIYTVSLFGHRNLLNPLSAEEHLEREIYKILKSHSYVNFLIGRTGEFDLLAALTIHRVMKTYSRINGTLTLVLPYQNSNVENHKDSFLNLYDEIEICQYSADAHYKSAFQARNQYMVDRSDLVLCCIEHRSGGAYQTIQYAQKQKCQIINLAQR
ncbi:MAG: SLOG family protein [Oscillospiraceae bacterium]